MPESKKLLTLIALTQSLINSVDMINQGDDPLAGFSYEKEGRFKRAQNCAYAIINHIEAHEQEIRVEAEEGHKERMRRINDPTSMREQAELLAMLNQPLREAAIDTIERKPPAFFYIERSFAHVEGLHSVWTDREAAIRECDRLNDPAQKDTASYAVFRCSGNTWHLDEVLIHPPSES